MNTSQKIINAVQAHLNEYGDADVGIPLEGDLKSEIDKILLNTSKGRRGMFYKFGHVLVNMDRVLSITAGKDQLTIRYQGNEVDERIETLNPEQELKDYRAYEQGEYGKERDWYG